MTTETLTILVEVPASLTLKGAGQREGGFADQKNKTKKHVFDTEVADLSAMSNASAWLVHYALQGIKVAARNISAQSGKTEGEKSWEVARKAERDALAAIAKGWLPKPGSSGSTRSVDPLAPHVFAVLTNYAATLKLPPFGTRKAERLLPSDGVEIMLHNWAKARVRQELGVEPTEDQVKAKVSAIREAVEAKARENMEAPVLLTGM